MGKVKNLKKVVIIGSGPIVIGQACEFDYSGTQACKALMQEGLEVVLINSNPATIMTDPEMATRVYIEPLKVSYVEKILEKEQPDAVIPTLGGQTALNLALELHREGVLDRLGIQLLGAKPQVIKAAEDREEFCQILDEIGANYPTSKMIKNYEEGIAFAEATGLPLILRPNYTLGGGGGGVAFSMEEYRAKLSIALHESPTSEVLVERSIYGWKEYELEVMRDRAGTFVVICSIENLDPCGVHTGDSITIAPQQTLSDKEYQAMRDEACKIIERVGVETGGANIQFAVNPENGDRVVIEMNPRVSRSSALASKATGFPIAKIAALLSIGYTLDEITNDITKLTPSCYEPALDYVVTKIPKFAFSKFPGAKNTLSTQMKSVGEVMGIGRTFKESFQKALVSMEECAEGFKEVIFDQKEISNPSSERIHQIYQAFLDGRSLQEIFNWTQISYWFLEQIQDIADFHLKLKKNPELTADILLKAKRLGFADAQIAKITGLSEKEVRLKRWKENVIPSYFQVDTCAGEFASSTPYFYSTYWGKRSEFINPTTGQDKVVVLGSGPNRIGQGVEFDYSCVRSVKEFQKQKHTVVMVNSNPETVSTDYDTSDALFFEPLTSEHSLEVLKYVDPKGFVAQLGGQTSINIAPSLVDEGFSVIGSGLDAINLAEDRGKFIEICKEFGFKIPKSGMASSTKQALEIVKEIGYPVMCRPSYVLGGRRMEIIETEADLELYFKKYAKWIGEDSPCLMDQFLERALEVDVDLVRGKDWTVIGGIVEHIEAAGVHSGDSMGVLPPQRLKEETSDKIEELSRQLAERLGVLGFLNLQLAIKDDEVFMIEANPRSSRSVPFVAKASQVPLVDLGVRAMLGFTKEQVNPAHYDWKKAECVSVKGVVFPFKKFPEADSLLGPEMKSTGESMGRGNDYAEALLKALYSSHIQPPKEGEFFFSLREKDKPELLKIAKQLIEMGYTLSGTTGTATYFNDNGVPCIVTKKVHEGRPNCIDRIRSGSVSCVVNTTSGREAIDASFGIRRSCTDYSIPCITESDAAKAFMIALKRRREKEISVAPVPPMNFSKN